MEEKFPAAQQVRLLRSLPTLALAGCAGILVMLAACSRDGGEPVPPKPDQPPKAPAMPAVEALPPQGYSTEGWPTRETAAANEWEEKFLTAATDEERAALIDEKRASGPEFLAGLIRRALDGYPPAVKFEAVEAARMLRENSDIVDILSAAASDVEQDVARLAMDVARDAPFEARLEIHRNALRSPHAAVREMAIVEFMRERNKTAFEHVFDGLADLDEGVLRTTDDALFRVLGERFATRQEALEWWGKNSQDFTDKMIYIGTPK